MLSNTAALLDDPAQWGREWGWEHHTLYMAVLESFLVHVRNLMDFFCPSEGYETGLAQADGHVRIGLLRRLDARAMGRLQGRLDRHQ